MYQPQVKQIDEFFATARERYNIFLARQRDIPGPWSKDPAFNEWRFCNVFREDDKVTIWIRENVREPLRCSPHVLIAMVVCRLFNKIDTLEIIHREGLFRNEWNSNKARKLLKDKRPIVGAAYVVKTPDGMNKLDGILCMVDHIAKDSTWFVTQPHIKNTLQSAWEMLRAYPCIGNFMAYEIVSDLRHTWMLNKAPDIMTWANPGPGACRGLSWIVAQNMEEVRYGNAKARRDAITTMMRLLHMSQDLHNWPANWPNWEMREVEHWLCEYAKWVKVTHLGQRMKRRYI